MNVELPQALAFLQYPARYKVGWGGRGGTKSWGFATALVVQGAERPLRILCARETQKSIKDSVHTLLRDTIERIGAGHLYEVQEATIRGKNGTEIIFAGLHHNIQNIKSAEGIDIVWVEEASSVSKHSWQTLIPTIRKKDSEIWVSFNPELYDDDTYQRFIIHPPPDAVVRKLSWRDNPWFNDVMRGELEHLKNTDYSAYLHVWEGECKAAVEGAIYEKELAAAEIEGRIMGVPYDATRSVYTFWDLGFGDFTSIWFAQSVGFEFRIIDYYQSNGKNLPHYLGVLQSRGYVYDTDWLPHDAQAHELGSGRSIEELMRAAGRKVGIVKKLSVSDGINAARTIFPQCYFDREKCALGLHGLRNYQWGEPSASGVPRREPLHDFASHPADAFRYLALAIREPKVKPKQQMRRPEPAGVWG